MQSNEASTMNADNPPQASAQSAAATAAEPNKSKISKKKAKRRSEVWQHFIEPESGDENPTSKCKHCHQEFCSDSKVNGTSSLKYHLKICKKFASTKAQEAKQSLLIFQNAPKGQEGSSLTTWKFDQEAIKLALVKMIIVDELPFKFVEGDGFKHFMSVACPRFNINSRWTFARAAYELYLEEKSKLKTELKRSKQRVCLTTDTWTSLQRLNYMCLTVHYIDQNWKLTKKILNFCLISSHKGESIGRAIEKCLQAWEIFDVLTITVDNASSNDTAIEYLKRRMKNQPSSILQGKYLHIRCVAHILNLVVTDGLRESSQSLDRIRAAIKYVRGSPARLQKFKECISIEKNQNKSLLCLDVCTRWNSTYKMLDVALKFQDAFERYDEVESNYRRELASENACGVVDDSDWINVKRLTIFLEHFYEITLRVSGSKYVTSNTFFEEITSIDSILTDLELGEEKEMRVMAEKMRQKYTKYWGKTEKMNKLIYVAATLDPRQKMAYVEFALQDMHGKEQGSLLAKNIKDSLYEIFYDYKRIASKNSIQSSSDIPATSSPIVVDQPIARNLTFSKFKKFKSETGSSESRSDLDKYLLEENESDSESFDILGWWKLNCGRFPLLFEMARDILAIPMSTVASESAFSTGGRVLDVFRSSLTPKIVQTLLCTQDWLRGSLSGITDIEEPLDELEKLENIQQELDKLGIDIPCDVD